MCWLAAGCKHEVERGTSDHGWKNLGFLQKKDFRFLRFYNNNNKQHFYSAIKSEDTEALVASG